MKEAEEKTTERDEKILQSITSFVTGISGKCCALLHVNTLHGILTSLQNFSSLYQRRQIKGKAMAKGVLRIRIAKVCTSQYNL